MEKRFHHWVTVTKEKAAEIVLGMKEDQGELIKYIHKYRDEDSNEIKYCLAKVKTGGRQIQIRHIPFLKRKILILIGFMNCVVIKDVCNGTISLSQMLT